MLSGTLRNLWYQQGWLPRLLLLPLRPVSWLYRLLASARKSVFMNGMEPRYQAPVPVIIVGNISVGGAGKTPLVIELVDLLREQGWTPGVISRGYQARNLIGPRLLRDTSAAHEVGDEPMLIAQRTAAPVCVFPKRQAAIEMLLQSHDVDIIVCDDGLQHYALKRDLEIAVVDAQLLHGNGLCLPAGPLRESTKRLDSVDFTVYNGQHGSDHYYTSECKNMLSLSGGESILLSSLAGQTVHAVAGIGHPQRFFELLRMQGITLIEHAFADHHAYLPDDLNFADDLPIVMTEKDAIKCSRLEGITAPCWSTVLDITLSPGFKNDFLQQILGFRQSCGRPATNAPT